MAQKKTTRKKKKNKKKGSFITLFWLLLLSAVAAVALLFLLASFGVFGSLPDETSLENPEKNLATEIISTDGKVIGKFYKENRTPVAYQELPEHLKNALLATEDIRFYDHSGIDIRGTLRAAVYLGSKGGATLPKMTTSPMQHSPPEPLKESLPRSIKTGTMTMPPKKKKLNTGIAITTITIPEAAMVKMKKMRRFGMNAKITSTLKIMKKRRRSIQAK